MKRLRVGALALCLVLLCNCSAAESLSPSPSYRGTLPSQKPSQQTQAPAPESTLAPTSEPTPTPALVQPQGGTSSGGNSGGGISDGGNSGGGTGDGSNFQTWDNPDQQQTSQTWVLNTYTMKVHYPSCSSVSRIAPQNYTTSNASLNELLGQGYSRCGRCF